MTLVASRGGGGKRFGGKICGGGFCVKREFLKGHAGVTSLTVSHPSLFVSPLARRALAGLQSYKSFMSPWRIYGLGSVEMESIALIIDEPSI